MSELSLEDMFKLVLIDVNKKTKLSINLKDENGDILNLKEVIETLSEYVKDKVESTEDNSIKQQIFPLMSQVTAYGFHKLLGSYYTAVLLSNENLKYGFIYMSALSFLLLKWIQNNNIKIYTDEEPVSQEEIDNYNNISKASEKIVSGTVLGMDTNKIIQDLIDSGTISEEDIQKLGYSVDGIKNKKEFN